MEAAKLGSGRIETEFHRLLTIKGYRTAFYVVYTVEHMFQAENAIIAGSAVKLEPIISHYWLRTCRLHLISNCVETAEPSGLTPLDRHRSLGVTIVRSFHLIDAHAPGKELGIHTKRRRIAVE